VLADDVHGDDRQRRVPPERRRAIGAWPRRPAAGDEWEGSTLDPGGINYETLRMQEAMKRLKDVESLTPPH
jgi:hypothetical protein